MKSLIAALLLLPTVALANDLTIDNPMVPLAPPGVKAHAAFMSLSNPTDSARQIIGVSAKGYMMAHIHMSEEKNGIATMSSVDLIEVAPGQTLAFEHGGLHIMLMHPMGPKIEGDVVEITLEFADGGAQSFDATVMKMSHGM